MMNSIDVKQAIYSFWGRKNISDMSTNVSDFLIKIPGTDLRFALKILEDLDTDFKAYKAKLASTIQLRGAPKVPLVIATPDLGQQIVIGIVVRWQFGTSVLEDNPAYLILSEGNRARIYDEIKASDETIRMLESTNCKVVKHLKITEEFNRRLYHAEIVYLRDLSLAYRMKGKGNMSYIERFEYYYKGIPQEDYPFDKLDEGIVNAIKEEGYRNIKVISQLLLFSSELRDLRTMYRGRNPSKVEFLVLPDYSSFHLMVGKTVEPFYLDMFLDTPNNFTYQKTHFTINIPLNNANDYYNFMDGTKTLSSVSQLLSR